MADKEVVCVEAEEEEQQHEIDCEGDDQHMEAPVTPNAKRPAGSAEGLFTPKKTKGPPTPEEVQNQILQAVLSLQTTTNDTKALLGKLTDRVMRHDEVSRRSSRSWRS